MYYLIIIATVVIILLFILNACKGSFGENDIAIEDFIELLKQDSSLVILDVRNPKELEGKLGKIDDGINIPVSDLKNRMIELDKYRNKTIYVICRSGNRSKLAVKQLLKHNFIAKNVWGGMKEYRSITN